MILDQNVLSIENNWGFFHNKTLPQEKAYKIEIAFKSIFEK